MITEVAGQYNAQDLENEVRVLWERSQTYRKVREMRVGGKKFFFVDEFGFIYVIIEKTHFFHIIRSYISGHNCFTRIFDKKNFISFITHIKPIAWFICFFKFTL